MSQDPFRRQRIAWFVGMNLIAVLIAGGLFTAFLYGDVLDRAFLALTQGLFGYKLVVVVIAMSPLLASLLVGMAYAQRALRRKRAQAAGALPPAPSPSAPSLS